MINIVIKKHEHSSKICFIEVKGHAGSAKKGEDLVCAAVSAIVVGGFNSLNPERYEFVVESGYASVKAKAEPTDRESAILDTISVQLFTVSESNPEYVKIS